MNIWDSIVLGIVEGITEFLPVSSTGHLLVTQQILGLQSSSGLDAYLIVIQFGAIAAILSLYPQRIAGLFKGIAPLLRREKNNADAKFLLNLIIAFIPAAIIGLALDHWIEAHLFNPFTVAMAFILGGLIMLIWGRQEGTDKIEDLSWKQSLTIGVWQIGSLWPGMSRSMTTIVGGSLNGLTRAAAAEFSFILGVAVLSAASLYKAIKFHHEIASLGLLPVAIGMLSAFLSAWIVVKLFVGLLNRFGLAPWGYYRFVAAGVVLALFK